MKKGMIFIDGSNVFLIGRKRYQENSWIFRNILNM